MNILVIGGTGAFGARMSELLARDGHTITIAARSVTTGEGELRGQKVSYLTFDRNGALDGFDAFDLIVDAAGPFHAYGDHPYRVAQAAIAVGVHYFDLSDNADFCQGIRALDGKAKAAGVCVISGMSSVPAVSSAAVDALRAGQTPLVIESAILPGNKAPRGRAVVESILNQTGMAYPTRQGGKSVTVRSWSDPRWYDLGEYRRQGWRIEVPDQRLFPDHFNCETVAFRASLELGVMRYGLGVLSYLRAKLGFGMPSWLISLVMVGARLLAPFGTDRGGMAVEVTLPRGAGFIRKTWRLRAKSGDGPYVPGIAVRAACRNIEALKAGASPALSLITREQIEDAMDDLDIACDTVEEDVVPPFQRVLGAGFATLPVVVQTTHASPAPRHFKGRASVTRGRGILAKLAALLFGFPPSNEDIEVTVTKQPKGESEVWHRRFGTRLFRSYLRPTARGMSERFGPFTFDLGLEVKEGALHFPVRAGRCLGISIPKALLPISEATETDHDGVFHFDVHLKSPTGGTLVHYRGWLKADTIN